MYCDGAGVSDATFAAPRFTVRTETVAIYFSDTNIVSFAGTDFCTWTRLLSIVLDHNVGLNACVLQDAERCGVDVRGDGRCNTTTSVAAETTRAGTTTSTLYALQVLLRET